jgi:uncharacterized RDD family membrane protein YckC
MTTGGFDPNQNPQGQPPGSYPPPGGQYPPPQQGSYPPPQQGSYPPPQQGSYPPPQQGGQFGQPQYGQTGGYPTPPQFNPNEIGGTQPGDLWVRLGARIIDGVIVGIVTFILALLFSSSGDIIVTGLLTGILGFAYFVGLEVSQGQTLGKKILGLSVQGPGGAPRPTPQQSAIRNAFMLFSIIPFVGGFLALVAYIVIAVTINNSPTKQGKHDELAGGTQVVKR